MAAAARSDLTRRVQHDLASGRPRDDVVQDLIAGGLSRASAELFVDRALAARPPGASAGETDESPPRSPRDRTSGDSSALASGTLWLSLGCCITLLIFLLAEEGKAFLFGPAAVSIGLVLFIRGLLRWRDSFAPLPWGKVIAAGAVPLLGSVAILGFVSLRESRRQEAVARADVEREMQEKREEARRIQQNAEREERQRARLDAARVARREQDAKSVQRHLERLRSSRTSSICGAARQLARMEAYEAIPDLEAALRNSTSTSAQNCVADALVDLGEIHTALNFYIDGATSRDLERRRLALGAFGDLGPAGVEAGLPYLEQALRSSEQVLRFAAVLSLSKMGEAGEPLLRQALDDPDPGVRRFAAQALARR